jgi:hypothetical protein
MRLLKSVMYLLMKPKGLIIFGTGILTASIMPALIHRISLSHQFFSNRWADWYAANNQDDEWLNDLLSIKS